MNLVRFLSIIRAYAFLVIVSTIFCSCCKSKKTDPVVAFVIDSKGNIERELTFAEFKDASLDFYTGPSEKVEKECIASDENYPFIGKIVNGQYLSPNNIFSCKAEDFGQNKYLIRDMAQDNCSYVEFYSPYGAYRKTDIYHINDPKIKGLNLKHHLTSFFDLFAFKHLGTIEKGDGVTILNEEMIDDKTLFIGLVVEKIPYLVSETGYHPPAARGYFLYFENDKLVILANQCTTVLTGEIMMEDVEELRKDLLRFKKTVTINLIEPARTEAVESNEQK